jgi:hypothetical protein
MALGVVDLLESVQVHEEQGAGLVVTCHAGQGVPLLRNMRGWAGRSARQRTPAGGCAGASVALNGQGAQVQADLYQALVQRIGFARLLEVKRERAHHLTLVVFDGADQQALSPVDSKRAR